MNLFSLQKSIEDFLPRAHADEPSHIIQARNVMAGYARVAALQANAITGFIANDPVYIECKALMQQRQLLTESRLINLFLILKYGLKNLEGNIIEFGSYRGGSAIFLAAAARAFGLKTTVYALDTFDGMPLPNSNLDFHDIKDFEQVSFQELLAYKEKWNLTNLIFVKGRFEETALPLLEQTQNIVLAHIDCDLYESTKCAIELTLPHLHSNGGYIIFDDALQSTCLGALQAVEELVQDHHLRAEQSFPHLVYRYPKIKNS